MTDQSRTKIDLTEADLLRASNEQLAAENQYLRDQVIQFRAALTILTAPTPSLTGEEAERYTGEVPDDKDRGNATRPLPT